MARELKFRETLAGLLIARGFRRKRNAVARGVFVSPSALSQYLSGRAQPGLETLVRLANFLDTSLDYLVFGEEHVAPSAIDPGPVARYIDAALAGVQKRTSDHAGLVGRIGQALAAEIDGVAQRLANEHTSAGGMLDDASALALETHSLVTDVSTPDLRYNVVETDDEQIATGMFTDVVASNISRRRTYRFLLSAEEMPWERLVTGYRRILSRRGISEEALAKRCSFKVTPHVLPIGFALYHLDIDALQQDDRLLYERVRHAIGRGDHLGYVLPPSNDLPENAIMGERCLHATLRSFEALWTSKSSVSL